MLRRLLPLILTGAALVAGCGDDEPSEREQFEAGIRDSLTQGGAPGETVECIIEASRTEISDDELSEFAETFEEEGAQSPELLSLSTRLARECIPGAAGAAP